MLHPVLQTRQDRNKFEYYATLKVINFCRRAMFYLRGYGMYLWDLCLNGQCPTHSSFEVKKSGDQFPQKVTTCSRHYKPKLILPLKSVLLYNLQNCV